MSHVFNNFCCQKKDSWREKTLTKYTKMQSTRKKVILVFRKTTSWVPFKYFVIADQTSKNTGILRNAHFPQYQQSLCALWLHIQNIFVKLDGRKNKHAKYYGRWKMKFDIPWLQHILWPEIKKAQIPSFCRSMSFYRHETTKVSKNISKVLVFSW